MTNSSTKEARLQLEQGLRSVRRMPEGVDEKRLEFVLHPALGPAVMTIEGYGSEAEMQTLGCAEKLPDLKDARTLLAELDAQRPRGTTSWLFRRHK
jgi:hypothetical protein